MKALVTVPLDLYQSLEPRCAEKSLEFKLLKSGLRDENRIFIRCDEDEARRLVDWSEQAVPGANARINVAAEPGE